MSLRWKILAWFFVNLAAVGLLVSAFLLVQFRVGMSSLLAGSTDDRLEAIAQPLAAELRRLPAAQWSGALDGAARIWRARGIQVALFRDNGEYLAGDIKVLPDAVRAEQERHNASRHHGPPPGRGGRPPGERPWRERFARATAGPPEEPGRSDPNGPAGPPPEDGPIAGPEGGPPLPPGEPDSFQSPEVSAVNKSASRPANGPATLRAGRVPDGPPPPDLPLPTGGSRLDKFMLVAGHPRLYWTGVYLGEVRRGPASSLTLVLASPSLSGGGLFFDYKPWLALGGSLVLLSILWWLPFVRGLTGSLARMTDVAEEIARGQFRTARPSHRRDELGRLGRALDHMSARLEGYVTGQKRFLGDTAHELLSPLARLEVALSILEQRSGSPDDRRYVERSLEEVRQMSGLVNDLLAYTKAGLRAQTAELRPVAVAEVARLAVARELAEEKVTVDVPEDCRVQADPELLLRALSNGVRNALCYAAQGGPIAITAEPAEAPAGGCIDVSVVDQGPGVAPEYIDRLFDPFFRPEDARTRETGGTGLGLAIVKTCIEACGGTAQVRNRVPHGLLLTFRLPGATCEAHDARGGDSAVLATREIER